MILYLILITGNDGAFHLGEVYLDKNKAFEASQEYRIAQVIMIEVGKV